MSTISDAARTRLRVRGIEITKDNLNITLTTKGIGWLINYLYESGDVGNPVTLKMLKNISSYEAKREPLMETRARAIIMPTLGEGNTNDYTQVTFYLNGTPPKIWWPLPPVAGMVNKSHKAYIESGLDVKFKNDFSVYIKFTDKEAKTLNNGDLLCITRKTLEGNT